MKETEHVTATAPLADIGGRARGALSYLLTESKRIRKSDFVFESEIFGGERKTLLRPLLSPPSLSLPSSVNERANGGGAGGAHRAVSPPYSAMRRRRGAGHRRH